MKHLLLILSLFLFSITTSGQKLFINSDDDICIELFVKTDSIGEYRFYMIPENNMTKIDTFYLCNWNELSDQFRSEIIEKWADDGRALKFERRPYQNRYMIYQPFLEK